MKKLLIIPMLAVAGMIFNSCNSTKVISSWKSPEAAIQKYNKVLVIGLMGSRDRELREKIENNMVQAFSSQGINAGSSYAEYGPQAISKPDEQREMNRIRQRGYDAVFTIALLNRSRERRYNPGSVRSYPMTYYNRFWGYYSTVYTRLYEPGYYTTSTNYILEGNFYSLRPDKIEYSAQTKSFDPGSIESLASGFSKALTDDMMKKGIFGR